MPQAVGGPIPEWSEDGGKRKGKRLKKDPRKKRSRGYVTVKQAKAALAIDPNAVYDPKLKCLIYKRG